MSRDYLADLPGLNPAWSRFVTAPDAEGTPRRWHVLDTAPASSPDEPGPPPAQGTMLCVHGNPTWSYLWRRFLADAPQGWRVIAVDQLGMGFSEPAAGSLAEPRGMQQRIDDLGRLTDALEITGPVVVVGHDWGGPISSGWALAHAEQLAGLVLANTAVHQPATNAPPGLIRLVRAPALIKTLCVSTSAFVRGTTALSFFAGMSSRSGPTPPKAVRDAFAVPYPSPSSRSRVGQFVADIPFEESHPSRPALDRVADGLTGLSVPVLLLRGSADPVFREEHLNDLSARMPHADVHRYVGASHLVTEDAPQTAEHVWDWLRDRVIDAAAPERPDADGAGEGIAPLWASISDRVADPAAVAVVEVEDGPGQQRKSITFAELEGRITDCAAGLAGRGINRGDRVGLLVPPGIELTVAVYACWRIGAVIVVADAGLGAKGLLRALNGANLTHLIAIGKGLALTRAMRLSGRRILAGAPRKAARLALGYDATLAELEESGRSHPVTHQPGEPTDPSAVLFTSGATGPSKGVFYRHDQLRAQAELIKKTYDLGPADRLVAAFAPFALYGPAIGIAAAVPAMDVTAPASLSATALAQACEALDATVVFASPAALRNIVDTQGELGASERDALARVRLIMSAGAPVGVSLLREVAELAPNARLRTPYGMTEALPVADIDLPTLELVGRGNGVCVGEPLTGVRVAISPLSVHGDHLDDGELTTDAGVSGEVCVAAAHVKHRYDRLWATERASSRTAGWHRTGDVGHLDEAGRIWIEGRRQHLIATGEGPGGIVTPVGLEQAVEELPEVSAAAVVGVGPVGVQQVVVVVVPARIDPCTGVLAPQALTDAVRDVAEANVAAVLNITAMPVDIRHQSKVDRTALGVWADAVLQGRKPGNP